MVVFLFAIEIQYFIPGSTVRMMANHIMLCVETISPTHYDRRTPSVFGFSSCDPQTSKNIEHFVPKSSRFLGRGIIVDGILEYGYHVTSQPHALD